MSESRRRHPSALVRMGLAAGPENAEGTGRRYSPAGMPWTPNADVVALTDEVVIRLEIPGADLEELTVIQDGREIVVQGVRPRPPESQGGRHEVMEIQYGPFARIFEFNEFVRLDDVVARYEAGFLTIRLAKCMKGPSTTVSLRVTVTQT